MKIENAVYNALSLVFAIILLFFFVFLFDFSGEDYDSY